MRMKFQMRPNETKMRPEFKEQDREIPHPVRQI